MLAFALLLLTQSFTQRGYVESSTSFYPQAATSDTAHIVGEVLFREEAFYRPNSALQISGGLDLRTDSHHQVERTLHFSWEDRELQRPLLALRRLSVEYHAKGFTVEAGKQFIRWGRADILNPTDRFAPRDFMTVVRKEYLGILAVRTTYEHGSNTIDTVWEPRFTPSRVPLAGQRWLPVPAGVSPPLVHFQIPKGSQYGIRWSHVGAVEFSTVYYQGFDDIPAPDLSYPKLQLAGGDAAIPLRWLTIRTEAGYSKFSDRRLDDYLQYVIQLERQSGEWLFVGGYTGEILARRGLEAVNFNPDRGMTKSVIGRAGYTIDANRNVEVETAVRQNGDGLWAKFEYSQAFGQHWRLTTDFTLIRGKASGFVGQYRRNSNGLIAVKYSF